MDDIGDLSAGIAGLELRLEDEVGELQAQLRSADDRARDLRAVNRDAYERTRPGTECRKVRYLHEQDAEQHAIWAAMRHPGETYRAYRCGSCRAFPATLTHPYHVGHGKSKRRGSMTVVDGVLHHGCGCMYGLASGEFVWRCTDHQL